jgi:hypothetical protein
MKAKVVLGAAEANDPSHVPTLGQLEHDVAGHQVEAALEHGVSWLSMILTD